MRRAKMEKDSPETTTKDKAGSGTSDVGISERVGVVIKIAATTIFLFVFIFLGLKVVPEPSPQITTLLGKVMYTLRWQVFSFFSFAVCIQIIAFTRLVTPAINPLSPRGLPYVDVYVRCLQNTLEQLVLSVPGQIILSGYLESDSLRIIPLLIVLFIIGRIAFWIGYPLQRVYGFVLTFIPTILTYVADIYFFITAGPTFGLE